MGVTEIKMLRWINGVTREDKIINEFVIESIEMVLITDKIREIWAWDSWIMFLRGEDTEIDNEVINMHSKGKRGSGKPKSR